MRGYICISRLYNNNIITNYKNTILKNGANSVPLEVCLDKGTQNDIYLINIYVLTHNLVVQLLYVLADLNKKGSKYKFILT